jgi:transcription termination factor Rho
LPKSHLDILWALRKSLTDTPDFVEKFLRKLQQSKTNDEFIDTVTNELKNNGVHKSR